MKHLSIFTLLLSLLFLVSSCKKDLHTPEDCVSTQSPCTFDTHCESSGSVLTPAQTDEYYEIWKSILMENSSMTEAYFDAHITNFALSSNEWDGGISFRVNYIMHIDWVDIKCSDAFLVNMSSTYESYGHLNIPRDVLLDEDQIKFNIANNVKSEVSTYNLIEELRYSSCDEVYEAAISAAGYEDELSVNRVSYYVPGKLPREDGDPYYLLNGVICSSPNTCLKGYINLVSGETHVVEDHCYIVD